MCFADDCCQQSQIDDLRNLSHQYEIQAAERMLPGYSLDELYVNQPVQVRHRHHS